MKNLIQTCCLMIISIISNSQIINIHDGDTFNYYDKESNSYYNVRIANIDAPELNQIYGLESKMFLDSLLCNSVVSLEFYNTDKYNRHVCRVFVNSFPADSILISKGLAMVYYKYNTIDKLINIEFIAKNNRAGIWSLNNFLEPWNFRKLKHLPKFKYVNFMHF